MYNFDLVASSLSFGASIGSDFERRSAWECFERFRAIYPEPQSIQITGPNRAFALNRLDKVARANLANRPRPNVIMRQPRTEVREHRYLNLFDVMKKSAKNREKERAKSQGNSYISLTELITR
jgi:hypothetical protein